MRRVLLVLGLLGCTVAPAEVGPDPLAAPDYVFCHDTDVAYEDVEAWCDLLDDAPPDACPGLRKACAQGPSPQDTDAPPSGCQGERTPPPTPNEAGPRAADAPGPPARELGVGELGVQLVRWILALALATALVALMLFFGRAVLAWWRRTAPRHAVAPAQPVIAAPQRVAEDLVVPTAPAPTLLQAAQQAVEDGRYDEAVLLARAASLRGLADRGLLRLHGSRTDREYVRALQRHADQQGRLRGVVAAVEALRWGGAPIDADRARAVVALAARLGAALLLMVGLTLAPDSHAAPVDHTADGRSALMNVFEQGGFQVSWRLRTVQSVGPDVHILVLDGDAIGASAEDHRAVRSWVEAGGVLVLVGDGGPVWPELGVWSFLDDVDEVWLSSRVRSHGLAAPVFAGGPRRAYVGAHGDAWVVASSSDAEADLPVVVQAMQLGEGGVVAIADPRLLDNASFMVPANVRFVGGAVGIGQTMGLWSVAPHATLELATVGGVAAGGSPAGGLSQAGMLPVVLQLLLVLAVLALSLGWAFAPLRDPPSASRLNFSQHAVAVGERWADVGGSRRAVSAAARLVLLRLGPHGLLAAAERDGLDDAAAAALVARAQTLADDPDGNDELEDLETLEQLCTMIKSP